MLVGAKAGEGDRRGESSGILTTGGYSRVGGAGFGGSTGECEGVDTDGDGASVGNNVEVEGGTDIDESGCSGDSDGTGDGDNEDGIDEVLDCAGFCLFFSASVGFSNSIPCSSLRRAVYPYCTVSHELDSLFELAKATLLI